MDISKFYSVIIGTLVVTSCANKERSGIEVIKVDKQLVEAIQSNYDSTYSETPEQHDFWTIDHYLTGSTTDKIIFKDSLGHIVGIVVRENGMNSFGQEYYSNGQARGKTDFSQGRIDGSSTYYYEDGRIRSKGKWSDSKQVGIWKDYDKDGYLISIKHYSNEGELEKEETVE